MIFFSILCLGLVSVVSRSSVGEGGGLISRFGTFSLLRAKCARMCNLRQTGLIPFSTSSHPREELDAIYRPVRHFLYAGTDTRNVEQQER